MQFKVSRRQIRSLTFVALGQALASPKSEAQWQDTLNSMVSLGATLGPEEQGRLAQYLAEHFGLQR